MNEYFRLLFEGKIDEANEYRKKTIPSKLIKFISLGDDENKNEKKFQTLSENKIWFCPVQDVNDPYEYQCLYIDEKKLANYGYPGQIIETFKKVIGEDAKKMALASFSANSFDCLPMWAYYTNNHRGFCVEYAVEKPDAIYKVSYEPNRIPIASIAANLLFEFQKIQSTGEKTNSEIEFYATLLKQQFYLKHESWSHENEYRIIVPKENNQGRRVPASMVGLRVNEIVAGINCKKEHIQRLCQIAHDLGCAPLKQAKTNDSNYTLLEEVNNGKNEI